MMFPIHHTFPKEMAIIGRLLVDYSELELDLMNCINAAQSGGLDTAIKAMFRVRGETNRIDIADGIGRRLYSQQGLEPEFDETIVAMRYSLRFRNQYAHAYWHDPDNGKFLCFVNLEELAKQKEPVSDLSRLTFFVIDVPTLEQQEVYFWYTRNLLSFINHEFRSRASGKFRNPITRPAAIQPPPKFARRIEF